MTTSVTAPAPTTSHPTWRRLAAVGAVAAPLSYALSAAVGVEHTDNIDRQLQIIAAHTGSFTAMVLLELVCYTLAAVTAVAVALRIPSGRGSRFAAAGAVLAVIGAVASINGFGGPLPTLAEHDPEAARYFVDHLGPIYAATIPLTMFLDLGLLAMFVGLWRSGRVAWPWLATSTAALVAGAVIGTARVENVIAMLVLAGGMFGVARFLASPDPGPTS
jgi:hypothetical protein